MAVYHGAACNAAGWHHGARGPGSIHQSVSCFTCGLLGTTARSETFEWVQQPADGCVGGTVYVDGSRVDGEWQLAGLCARHGWAFAAYDDAGALCAAAKGRPPAWAAGIYDAELWGLFMAAMVADG